MMKKETRVQPGTTQAPEPYKIVVLESGPYEVYGQPPLDQQFMMPDEEGANWSFKAGARFEMAQPAHLCRCGGSKNMPYCDGSHATHDWNPKPTASLEPLLDGAEAIEGERITLTDNENYCAFARMCDAKGRVWNLAEQDDERSRELVIYEANHCPAGRLSAWDPQTGKPFEPQLPISLALIEDTPLRCSGPLWVRGGIPVEREDGTTYEVRNRVTLCRCGQSANKPYCDGTHASMKFRDGLPARPAPDGVEW